MVTLADAGNPATLLLGDLKPGTRIVSHAFSMGDWEPAKVDQFQDSRGISRTLYLWETDGKVRE